MKQIITYHHLSINALHASYIQSNGKIKNVLSGISADIKTPGITCLMGANGSGKSTLLRNIAGIENPLKGSIAIDKINIQNYNKQQLSSLVSIVFTDTPIDTEITVYTLIALGRYPYSGWLGRLKRDDTDAVNLAIKLTGIEHLTQQNFTGLSDGEKQICMIARALAQETPFILLDEPTSFLDIPNKIKVMNLLKSLARNQNKYIIMATHDLDLALEMADHLWLIAGTKFYSGLPEDLILQNCFDEVFDNGKLKFNKLTAKFQLPDAQSDKHLIIHANDEILSLWTLKAMRKAGYNCIFKKDFLTSIPEVPIIECVNTETWNLSYKSENTEYNNLETLIYKLRHIYK